MVNRGILAPRETETFLNGTLQDLSSPFQMKDLEKASRRLVDAARRGEKILVYADYDADGSTGAACLTLFLSELFPAADVRIHQNHRIKDGYGLKKDHLEAAARSGVKLVVTVDGGITDVEAIRHASEAGVDVIVTDHHEPGEIVPPAYAILNPKQRDCPYPGKDLAGVGVVFLLMCGVRRLLREEKAFPEGDEPALRKYLDLVALGTVADMVPLRGDNRLLVQAGIEEIRHRARPGIRALLSVSGIVQANVNEIDLAFRIGPRLNAAGRVGDATRGSELLVTDSFEQALRIASELHQDNARRQREEERILREAIAVVESGPPPFVPLGDRSRRSRLAPGCPGNRRVQDRPTVPPPRGAPLDRGGRGEGFPSHRGRFSPDRRTFRAFSPAGPVRRTHAGGRHRIVHRESFRLPGGV